MDAVKCSPQSSSIQQSLLSAWSILLQNWGDSCSLQKFVGANEGSFRLHRCKLGRSGCRMCVVTLPGPEFEGRTPHGLGVMPSQPCLGDGSSVATSSLGVSGHVATAHASTTNCTLCEQELCTPGEAEWINSLLCFWPSFLANYFKWVMHRSCQDELKLIGE